MKAHLIDMDEPVHCDESGLRAEGKRFWVHVTSTEQVTFQVHRKRGRQALDQIGILPKRKGRVVHDGYNSYRQYPDAQHALCNAHHPRELVFAKEQDAQDWADKLIALLVEIKDAIAQAKQQGQVALTSQQQADLESRYDHLITQGLETNPPPPDSPTTKRGRKRLG